jgi:8-oxo-dGTP diphosphatase
VTTTDPISIVAALIRSPDGRVLLVRKRGTSAFMQPGGKREPGEDDGTALARELHEELSCRVIAHSLRRLGEFHCQAANEKTRRVAATVYAVEVAGTVEPRAEIDEILWLDPAMPPAHDLAPLTRDFVLPLAVSAGY